MILPAEIPWMSSSWAPMAASTRPTRTLALWSSGEKILTNSDNVRLGEFPGRASLLVLDSCWVLSGNNVDAGNAHVDGDKFDGSGVDQPVKSGWMFNRWVRFSKAVFESPSVAPTEKSCLTGSMDEL